MLDDLRFRVRALFRRTRVERDLDDELRFHRDRQLQQYLGAGVTPDEARRRLALDFGGVDQVKDDCRDVRGLDFVAHARQDARYALRAFAKAPGFAAIAVCTLALGVGANTAIFSIVYDTLLRPLPYRDPSRLVVLNETTPRVGTISVSVPNYLDWRAQSRTIPEMAVVASIDANLAGGSEPKSIGMEAVSSNFLSMIGVRPEIGRDFTAAEDAAGTAPVALISHYLWETHFGSDEHVLGRGVTLDDRPYTIVGVLPRSFKAPDRFADVIEPLGVFATRNDSMTERGDRGDTIVVGRMAGGVTVAQAQSEMNEIAMRLARAYPVTNDQFGALVRPIRDLFVGDVRAALLVLFGAVTCVLLIACANVANLVLIRGAGRTREIALRMALGASRGRVVRQLLTESAVLACLGGSLGLALAIAGVRGLTALMTTAGVMTGGDGPALSVPVLLFAASAAILATLIVGIAPALHASRTSPQIDLKDGARGSTGSRRQRRWRSVLAVAEVALALVLLVGAGLMMKSLSHLLSVDGGFRTDHVLTTHLGLRGTRYESDGAIGEFWQTLLDRTRAIPGVSEAALGTGVPLTGDHSRSDIMVEGMAMPQPGSYPHPDVHRVSGDYMRALGIAVLRGRTVTDDDTDRSSAVIVINKTIADKYFAGQDPVGRRIAFGRTPPPGSSKGWLTVVGVVSDTKLYGLDNPSRLEVYLPYRIAMRNEMTLIVKSPIDPASLTASIRAVVHDLDPNQPLSTISTMDELKAQSMSTRRLTLWLLGVFSALAVVLSAIGIYGVMSYAVTQRTHELGVRLALGAAHSHVLGAILGQGMTLAGAGIVVGIAAALGVTRLMTALLFDVSAVDPAIFAGVAAAIAAIALVACYLPARRTLRLDPLVALRHE